MVDEVYQDSLESFRNENVRKEGKQLKINKSKPEILRRYIYDLIKPYGFNREQSREMITAINEVGKSFHSKEAVIFVDRMDFILTEIGSDIISDIEIFEDTIEVSKPILIKFFTTKELSISKDINSGQFDKDKLKFPLTLSQWKEGDRIQPLGMKGSKKVSDILIDKKISRADKQNVMVLKSGDEIIWILGITVSEKVKVDESTNEIWQAIL